MILGVSHLALYVADIECSAPLFLERGWNKDFFDPQVDIQAAERLLLPKEHPPHQSVLMLRHERWPAIELIACPTATPELIAPSAWLTLPETGHATACLRLTQQVPSIPVAAALWQKAGFRQQQEHSGEHSSLWMLTRPLATWNLETLLVESDADANRQTPKSPGVYALSLLCSNLDADLQTLATLGSQATAPFHTRVNGKDWRMALILLSGGLIIELLDMRNTRP